MSRSGACSQREQQERHRSAYFNIIIIELLREACFDYKASTKNLAFKVFVFIVSTKLLNGEYFKSKYL